MSAVRDWARQVMGEAVRAVVEETRQATPVRTGVMRDAVQAGEITETPGELRCEIAVQVPYASFVDLGTQPHPIVARRAPALHFFWERMGVWMTVRSVQHPGNRPFDFFTRPLPQRWSRAVEEAARHAGR